MSFNARLRNIFPVTLLLASLAVAGTASAARTDTVWPHEFKTSKGTVLSIYEPQLESLEGDRLTGHGACSVRGSSGSEPIFGVFWFTATVKRDAATVKLVSIDVTQVKFPDRAPEVEKSFATIVERDLPGSDLSWTTEWMNEALQASKAERGASEQINNTPPAIVVSTEPTVLIQYDGEPQLRPIDGAELSRVVNTPYFVVFDPAGKNYYLGSDQFWYQAKDAKGPWEVIANPPSNVIALKPEATNESALPKPAVTGPPPKVIVATLPTELIVYEGEPQFKPVASTNLLHVTNCDKDVFKDVASQTDYVLLSGRWFESKKATGPWSYVPPDKLPASFAAIPAGSEFSHVLASIPSTPQAEEAILAAQVPQVAAVERGQTDFEVWYDEDPVFKKIKGTDIEYAVNASASVFRTEGKYYACDKGIWYVSDGFDGPWYVSDTRPEGLDAIPPDNPNYNTKYVYVYDSTPTEVYVGYTPGYLGCYPYHGAVYYGTGYCYDPWYGSAYYAYPWTWGLGVAYTPYAGWGFNVGFGTGFVSCGMTWGWGNYGYPYYGGYYGGYYGYGYCGGWYGPGGYYPAYPSHYANPYSAGYGNTRTRTAVAHPANIYDRETTRYRKGSQVDAANGKQVANRSGSRYASPNRERSTVSNRGRTSNPGGSRYTSPYRNRNVAPNGSRYSSPYRTRSSALNGNRYSAPNGNRYDRSYRPGYSRYRDGAVGSRPNGNSRYQSYGRPGGDYRGGQLRGTPSQPRGYGSQYRAAPGNQSFGRSSVGARGGYSGGGGGGGRAGGGGGGGGGARHR